MEQEVSISRGSGGPRATYSSCSSPTSSASTPSTGATATCRHRSTQKKYDIEGSLITDSVNIFTLHPCSIVSALGGNFCHDLQVLMEIEIGTELVKEFLLCPHCLIFRVNLIFLKDRQTREDPQGEASSRPSSRPFLFSNRRKQLVHPPPTELRPPDLTMVLRPAQDTAHQVYNS